MASAKPSRKIKAGSVPNELDFKLLFENHPMPMWVSDLETMAFLEVNEAALEKYGYARDEFLRLTIKDILLPEYVARWLKVVKRKRPHLQQSGQWQHRLQDGGMIEVEIKSHTIEFNRRQAALVMVQDVTESKQAKATLRESETRWRFISQATYEGIIVHEQGQIVDVNETGARIVGYTQEELIGQSILSLTHPNSIETVLEKMRTGTEAAYEAIGLRKDGTTFPCELRGRNLIFQGKSLRVVIVRDLTEHKRANELLKEKDYLLSIAQRIARIGSWDADLATGRAIWSDEMYHIYDVSPETLVPTAESLIQLIHPDDQETMARWIAEAIAGKNSGAVVVRVIARDGNVRYIRGEGEIFFDEAGKPVRAIGTAQDITERVLAEKALREREAQFRAIFENALIGIGVADMQGNLLVFNDAMLKPGGYTRDDIVKLGNVGALYYDPKQRAEALALFQQQGFLQGYEARFKRKDGTPYDTILSLTKTTFNGQPCIQAILEDISERKMAEQALRNSQAQMEGIVNSAMDAIITVDDDQRIIIFNPAAEQMFRCPAGETIGQTLERFIPEYYRERHKESVQAYGHANSTKRSMKTPVLALTCLRADGEAFPSEVSISQLEFGGKKLYTAIVRDISERAQAEVAFQAAEEKYRAIFEGAVEGIFQSTPEGRFLTANAALARMWGYNSPEELISSIKDIGRQVYAQPDQRQEFARLMQENEEVHGFVYEVRHKDGGTLWVSENARAVRDASGTLLYFEGNIEDITDRIQAEEALHQRLADLTTIHQTAKRLTELQTPESLAREIISILEETLNYEYSAVLLIEKDPDRLRPFALSDQGKGVEFLAQDKDYIESLEIPVGKGITGWVAQNGLSVRLDDVRQDERYLAVRECIRSELCVPLRIGERVIGVVNVESTRPNAYSESDQRVLETVAAQIAIAIQNANLFEEIRQRVAELEFLHATANISAESTTEDSLLERITALISETFYPDNVGFLLMSKDNDFLLAHPSYRGVTAENIPEKISLHASVVGRVAASGLPLRIGDVGGEEDYLEVNSDTRSELCVPVTIGGRVLGVINAESHKVDAFSEADERLLDIIAGQAATTLERIRLFDDAQRRAEEFAALYDTSISLSAEHDLNTLLQSIVKKAAAMLNSYAGGMYLYDPVREELEMTFATEPSMPVGTRLNLGEGVAGRIARTHQAMRIEDYSTWEGRSQKYQGSHIRATIEVPMLYRGELVGVLVVHETGASERQFTMADERMLSLFASQAAAALQNARLFVETQRRLRQTKALRQIDQAIAGSMNLHWVLETALTHALGELGVDAAVVLLHDPYEGILKYELGSGFRTEALKYTVLKLGEGYAGQAALTRQTVRIADLRNRKTDFLRSPAFHKEGFICYFGVPLIAKGEIKGVLELFHRAPLDPDKEWLDFMESLAGQVAIAIDNATLYKDLQRSNAELTIAYDATIEGWSKALDLRDKETEGHTLRVTELTLQVAEEMGISKKELVHIQRGALLHDIGKMGIPDSILLKPDKLTEEEWELMRKHPVFAYEMLKPISYLRPALDIPYCHHEKWDGTGYPRGLKGEQIPQAARIFAVVDVWDALTSDRPYRKAWTRNKALEYIREQSGHHFDPQVIEEFLKLVF